jgi:imidazole glycerol-phosphate synthase subunit HisH
MVTIIDYGMGNLGSISNMIKKIGYQSELASEIKTIERAKKIILPGIGSFDEGMNNLKDLGLIDVLNKKILIDKTPVLGICLGMQLMTSGSEEGGGQAGFGWIDAEVKKIKSNNLKVPHMGWNIVKHRKSSKLFSELTTEKRFYFVHNYYVNCNNSGDVLTTTPYGHDFTSSFERDNIVGVQFHPEKSHKFGMHLIKNFMEI